MLRDPFLMGICLALVLPAFAGAQAPGAPPPVRESQMQPAASPPAAADGSTATCESGTPAQEPDDPRWRWRLRAYRHLDCVVSLVDAALRERVDNRGERARPAPAEVVVSREDLERIRTLAWWARDAAARIGQ